MANGVPIFNTYLNRYNLAADCPVALKFGVWHCVGILWVRRSFEIAEFIGWCITGLVIKLNLIKAQNDWRDDCVLF